MEEKIEEIARLTADLNNCSLLLKAGRKASKVKINGDTKIAVLGTCSIQHIVQVLRAILLADGVKAEFYEGEYNGIRMDILDDSSPLYSFNPDIVIILPDYRDVRLFPIMFSEEKEVEKCIEENCTFFMNLCERVHTNLPNAQVLLSNIVTPIYRQLGNMEANYVFSKSYVFDAINAMLTKKHKDYAVILDMNYQASLVGKNNWFDDVAYVSTKSGFNLKYIGLFCEVISKQIMALTGKQKKCLVLDLDNTLWGGTVGDLGYDGINLDPNDPLGESYLEFQKYILELKQRGVILAVCSKNEIDLAKEAFDKNSRMLIKYDDISCFIANWDDKATNIRKIASEINIGIDSLVFFDDNPTERQIVRQFVPEVTVIDVPEDPALYVRALDQSKCFEWAQLTKEDLSRSKTYVENRKREEILHNATDYNQFLEMLEMNATFEPVNENTISRFSQLINKSNQFNLRTQRYTETQIHEMMDSDEYKLFTVSLNDRFSEYGIIACLILQIQDNDFFIDSWVMSCRVLKKTVENYTFNRLIDEATRNNIGSIKAEYIPTEKNKLVKELLPDLGFKIVNSCDNVNTYILELKGIDNKQNTYIKEIVK